MERYANFTYKKRFVNFLINEGIINYDDKFTEILRKIKRKSRIANDLLKFYDSKKDISNDQIKQNYIDLPNSKSTDTVTFISQKKYDVASSKGIKMDPYNIPGRTEIKVGRVARALIELYSKLDNTINLPTDKEIEEFVNLFKSEFPGAEKFEIISGDDIKYWYDEKHYYREGRSCTGGPLGSSCMANVDEEYFDIYSESKNVSMLILTVVNDIGQKKLLGRAIVWKLYKSPCEAEYFMDRIYTIDDPDINKFKKYADNNRWMYKIKNVTNNNDGMFFICNGKKISARIRVKIKGDQEYYPYLDTLKYLNEDDDELSNVGYVNGYELESTEGDKDRCSNCNGKGYEDCDDCSGDGHNDCEECNGMGIIECDCEGDKNCKKCQGKKRNLYGRLGKPVPVKECPDCKGKGKFVCKTCKGTGKKECEECTGLINLCTIK